MFPLPIAAEALLTDCRVAFTMPTFRRALVLLVAWRGSVASVRRGQLSESIYNSR